MRWQRSPLLAFGSVLVMGLAWAACGVEAGVGTAQPTAQSLACSAIEDCYRIPEKRVLGHVCKDSRCVCPLGIYKECASPTDPQKECRLAADCKSDAPAQDAGPDAPIVVPECSSAADCPAPSEPRCATATCINGSCGFAFKAPGPLASQLRGDCKRIDCTPEGDVIEQEDPSDIYDDGNPCTLDFCAIDKDDMDQPYAPRNEARSSGELCLDMTGGFCYEDADDPDDRIRCVECVHQTCGMNSICSGTWCEPWDCPGMCGDACAPCVDGYPCNVGDDCQSGVCAGGTCQAATASDGVKNGKETGIDCGGGTGALCADGGGCAAHIDCTSGVCWAGTCQPASCTDGTQNQGEAAIDCGGPCSGACD